MNERLKLGRANPRMEQWEPIIKKHHPRSNSKTIYTKLVTRLNSCIGNCRTRFKDIPVEFTREEIELVLQAVYGGYCPYCNNTLEYKNIQLDHKTPVIQGGLQTKDNMQWTCTTCNRRKGNLSDAQYRGLLAALKELGFHVEHRVLKQLELKPVWRGK